MYDLDGVFVCVVWFVEFVFDNVFVMNNVVMVMKEV